MQEFVNKHCQELARLKGRVASLYFLNHMGDDVRARGFIGSITNPQSRSGTVDIHLLENVPHGTPSYLTLPVLNVLSVMELQTDLNFSVSPALRVSVPPDDQELPRPEVSAFAA